MVNRIRKEYKIEIDDSHFNTATRILKKGKKEFLRIFGVKEEESEYLGYRIYDIPQKKLKEFKELKALCKYLTGVNFKKPCIVVAIY